MEASHQPEDHKCHWKGCALEAASTLELKNHIEKDHLGTNKGKYRCEWAGCQFGERRKIYDLKTHVTLHHHHLSYFCKLCGKGFLRDQELRKHKVVGCPKIETESGSSSELPTLSAPSSSSSSPNNSSLHLDHLLGGEDPHHHHHHVSSPSSSESDPEVPHSDSEEQNFIGVARAKEQEYVPVLNQNNKRQRGPKEHSFPHFKREKIEPAVRTFHPELPPEPLSFPESRRHSIDNIAAMQLNTFLDDLYFSSVAEPALDLSSFGSQEDLLLGSLEYSSSPKKDPLSEFDFLAAFTTSSPSRQGSPPPLSPPALQEDDLAYPPPSPTDSLLNLFSSSPPSSPPALHVVPDFTASIVVPVSPPPATTITTTSSSSSSSSFSSSSSSSLRPGSSPFASSLLRGAERQSPFISSTRALAAAQQKAPLSWLPSSSSSSSSPSSSTSSPSKDLSSLPTLSTLYSSPRLSASSSTTNPYFTFSPPAKYISPAMVSPPSSLLRQKVVSTLLSSSGCASFPSSSASSPARHASTLSKNSPLWAPEEEGANPNPTKLRSLLSLVSLQGPASKKPAFGENVEKLDAVAGLLQTLDLKCEEKDENNVPPKPSMPNFHHRKAPEGLISSANSNSVQTAMRFSKQEVLGIMEKLLKRV